jgi:hypothetical protein
MKCIYGGFFLGSKNSSVNDMDRDYLQPMSKAGFNVCDLKLHNVHKISNSQVVTELKDLIKAINRNGMIFTAYLYPEYSGKRLPKLHGNLPAFVTENGEVFDNKFSLIHWEVWKRIFNNAFILARQSKTVPIVAVKIDIETMINSGISYDDKAWKMFAGHNKLNSAISKEKRFKFLKKQKLHKQYQKWFYAKFDEIAARFEQEMHRINPNLHLGVMPASNSVFVSAFIKKLGTKKAPAIIDNWSMYNGAGFHKGVIAARNYAKSLNPNNIFVSWFRINSYKPEYLVSHAYKAATECDGYSNWVLHMLSPNQRKLSNCYRLPAGTTPEQYYMAYRQANQALDKDMQSGSETGKLIPLKKIKPLVASLNLEKISFPQLAEAGSGEGEPQWITLRNQQVIYFNAQSGEDVKFEIKHLAGKKRPIALQYAILDSTGKILRNESVSPSEKTIFSVTFPKKGTGALVLSGGTGGQAWYGVKVYARHIGLFAKKGTYFFGKATFYVAPSAKNDEFLKIALGRSQCAGVAICKDNKYYNKNISHAKPLNISLKAINPIKISIYKRHNASRGTYFQDNFVAVKGISPYLSDGSERLLVNYYSKKSGIKNINTVDSNPDYHRLTKESFGKSKTRDGGFWINNITGSINIGNNKKTFVWVKYFDNGRRTMEAEINGIKEKLPYTRKGPQWKNLSLTCQGPVIKYSFRKINAHNPAIYEVIFTSKSSFKPEDI